VSAPLALDIRDLRCVFADPPATALAGVTLAVAPGELVAVMGESGAGKSTLLRCVNALVPSLVPATCSGDIRVGEMPVLGRAVGELGGRVAMVFQDFEAQLFCTNVRLEVAFGPGQLGVPGDEIARRVDAMLDLVDLSSFADRDPSSLSGGQKQRLAIASILAMKPDLMLLDEAGTDLDPLGRAELYAALARLRGEHVTLIAVEHEIDPLLDADRLVLMRHGAVVASGVPAALARDPALFLRCGVRPHDLAVLGERLGMELPLDVDGAYEALRRVGVGVGSRVEAPISPGERAALDTASASASERAATASSESAATPSSGAPPILEVEALSHAYDGGPPVLEDVRLRIGHGELIALIGQNGSGKTTLAKHLNGLLRPTHGRVRLDGVDLRGVPLERAAQQIGYVFQNPDHQLFAASVEEEVAFGPRNVGLEGAALEARVADVLAAVELDALRDCDPFLLSKGDRQRLAVATVLAMAPRVLILDEPTTGLDYPQQRRMLELLARLHAGGTTIVVITHSPWVVAEYAERALLMRAGRLVFDGPFLDLIATPDLLRSAAFELPPATRLGHAFGLRVRTAEELAVALGAPPRSRGSEGG
jgi:energy-coupling factor transport system ATP-binding protein